MRREHKQAKQDLIQAQRELEQAQDRVNTWWAILKYTVKRKRQLQKDLAIAEVALSKPLSDYVYTGRGDNKQYKHKGAQKVQQLQSSLNYASEHVQDTYQAIKDAPTRTPELQELVERLQNEVDNWEKLEVLKVNKPAKPKQNKPDIDTIRDLPRTTTGEALAQVLTGWKPSRYVTIVAGDDTVTIKVSVLRELSILDTIVLSIAPCEYTRIIAGYLSSPQTISGQALIVDYFMGQARLLHQQKQQADYRINLVYQ